MKCQFCGHGNSENARFCGVCGKRVGVDGENVSESSPGTGTQTNSPELPMVDFGNGIAFGFQNYFKFSGRATRAEYWWFALFTQLLQLAGMIPVLGWAVAILGFLATIIPSFSLSVRRLHDIGKSGWWMLVWLMIIVIYVILIIGFVISAINSEGPGISEEESFLIIMPWLVGFGVFSLVTLGVIIWWVVWFVQKGDKGPNKYGPDPRQVIISKIPN